MTLEEDGSAGPGVAVHRIPTEWQWIAGCEYVFLNPAIDVRGQTGSGTEWKNGKKCQGYTLHSG